MTVLCEICQESFSKYKCSTCFSPYCSLNCWKKHKGEEACKVKVNTDIKDNVLNCADIRKYFTEDTISDEKLSQLGHSEKLRYILSNRYLQSLLVAVENSPDPEEAIKQAMKQTEFVEFVNECLKIVEDPFD